MPKRVEHPIILGIVGDSASGKTTLSVGVAQILGEDHCTVICTDDYHRLDRESAPSWVCRRSTRAPTIIDILEQHLRLLRGGDPILKPVYDHRTAPSAGRICEAQGVRHRRRPARLCHARHARLL